MSTTKRLVRIAIFACILFCQEQALAFIPNVQLTQCLIAIYYFSFGLTDSLLIVFVHVLLDNIFMGSLSILYTPSMLIGWMSLPLILHAFRFIKNKWAISAIVGMHGIIYSFCFVLASCLIHEVPFLAYFIADIPFEIILIINGFITTFLLLEPCTRVLRSKVGDKKQENIREEE